MALMHLDTSGFDSMLRKLDQAGAKTDQVVERLLEKAGRRIGEDTIHALSTPHLPAQGRYSTGDTEKSVITDPKTHWEGMTAWVPIGFNFAQVGAGGFLLAGTPRMAPDMELRKIYKQSRYMNNLQDELMEDLWDELIHTMN